jgi:FdhD protein
VTSSCGACDQSNLASLIQQMPSVDSPEGTVNLDEIIQALYEMRTHQEGFKETGGMHAAGLFIGNGTSLLVREDIGRHNAVDKVYGCWSRNGSKPPLALLLSGRCGWDIVAKAASMGTSIIASFGAASSLAADAARWANITLVSFVRDGKAVVIGPVDGRFERKH